MTNRKGINMTNDTKDAIHAALMILKHTLVENGVSIAVTKKELSFFDTATYLKSGKYEGIQVKLKELVE